MNRWLTVLFTTLALLCAGALPVSAGGHQNDAGEGVTVADLEAWYLFAGMRLTTEEAEALEARLDADAHDLEARTRLIVYYVKEMVGEDRFGKSLVDPVIRGIHNRHALWLIENAPDADILGDGLALIDPVNNPEVYQDGKRAWINHLENDPTNVTFHGHAAIFFSYFHDRDLVVETLQKTQSLDPDNSMWPDILGRVYLRDAVLADEGLPEGIGGDNLDLPADGKARAVMALEQFQRAYELADPDIRQTLLLEAFAEAALRAGRYEDARTYATSILESEPGPYSDESGGHEANVILGRLALVEDDLALASYHLLEAGKVERSAPRGSFGPNMSLAAELLERGEKDVVLEYFELCSKFWPSEKLADWAAMVKGGRMPDFGGNLVY